MLNINILSSCRTLKLKDYLALKYRSLFQHFDAERLEAPPEEEDPSPGAVESDIILTDKQKAALEESENEGTNTLTKRKGVANVFNLWPNNTIPYRISSSAHMYDLYAVNIFIFTNLNPYDP